MAPLIFIILLAFLILGPLIVISHLIVSAVPGKEKPKYLYRRKQFFMTRAEHEFYKTLLEAVGQDYFVFAQVHLPTILDHTVRGQNWHAALAHINRKSVDFVICDKAYISPKLAIELDDRSHERPDRQERDQKVEKILENAGVPLLRLKNRASFNPNELKEEVRAKLGN